MSSSLQIAVDTAIDFTGAEHAFTIDARPKTAGAAASAPSAGRREDREATDGSRTTSRRAELRLWSREPMSRDVVVDVLAARHRSAPPLAPQRRR